MPKIHCAWIALSIGNLSTKARDMLPQLTAGEDRNNVVKFLGGEVVINKVVVPPRSNVQQNDPNATGPEFLVLSPIKPHDYPCIVSPTFSGETAVEANNKAYTWLTNDTGKDATTIKACKTLGTAVFLVQFNE